MTITNNKEHNEQISVHRFDKLYEMDKYLESNKLPKLTKREISTGIGLQLTKKLNQ